MFVTLGTAVRRYRGLVIALMVILMGALGAIGSTLPDRISQEGWFDPESDSMRATQREEGAFGRDSSADVIVLYHAPAGSTVDDPAFAERINSHLEALARDYPQAVAGVSSYWSTHQAALATPDKSEAFAAIQLHGTGPDVLKNYRVIEDTLPIDGIDDEVAGQTPVAGALDQGMSDDLVRAELVGLPITGVMLFFVFGGLIAAAMPLIVGVLSILGSLGLLALLTFLTPVNAFAQSVVTLIGLGLAIDYGLFIVSRFREELASGKDTDTAIRRTISTAGRTVVFSATMVAVSLSGLFLFPQGFLKSVAYGAISAVALAALLSITLLPAILSFLGPRIDAWSLPFMRARRRDDDAVLANRWGRIAGFSMKHPVVVAVPIIVALLLLIFPAGNIRFGGINETYLPPDNATRQAQEHFDEAFPAMRTNPVKIVVSDADSPQLGAITAAANQTAHITAPFSVARTTQDSSTVVLQTGVDTPGHNEAVTTELRKRIQALNRGDVPAGYEGTDFSSTTAYVGGNPALESDSVSALLSDLPLMAAYIAIAVTLLMFLAFGSLVVPVKATLMTVLGLCSTLGILTWIFIDGHFSGLLGFTPGPIMSAILVLIIAIIFGLSTDYEVFLVSRMVEARARGASTPEAIRFGIAHTGGIITAAAAILIVVTGAFGFSDIVMMKYIAYGMIAALLLDATVIRLLLVPSVMRLLGDESWWAPGWAKRIQRAIGLSETELADARPFRATEVDWAASDRYSLSPRAANEVPGSAQDSDSDACDGGDGVEESSGVGISRHAEQQRAVAAAPVADPHRPTVWPESGPDARRPAERPLRRSAYDARDHDALSPEPHQATPPPSRNADDEWKSSTPGAEERPSASTGRPLRAVPTSSSADRRAGTRGKADVSTSRGYGEAQVNHQQFPAPLGRHITEKPDTGRISATELLRRLREEKDS